MPGTYPTVAPQSTLAAIQQKVRRITRSPSEAQLTTDDLNNYINTFTVYDFPEHLRMFNLRTTFNFWCNPYQDVYNTDILSFGGAPQASGNALYDFQNKYLSIDKPLYIAGYQSFYTQSPEQFFGIYPQTNNIQSIGLYGNGVNTTFTGVIPILSQGINPATNSGGSCLVKGDVLFSSIDINNNGLAMVDVALLDSGTGNPTIWGNLYPAGQEPSVGALVTPPYNTSANFNPNNYINYVTGQFVVTFPVAPLAGAFIGSQTLPQITSLPQGMMFYDNQFVLRPIPDQPYQINFEAYIRPTQLFQTTSNPTLNDWWQYISWGTAKKIFEDRMDMDSVALIMPEYKKQEALVQRRTIVQYTTERVATIYTEQVGTGLGGGAWGQGGGLF